MPLERSGSNTHSLFDSQHNNPLQIWEDVFNFFELVICLHIYALFWENLEPNLLNQ